MSYRLRGMGDTLPPSVTTSPLPAGGGALPACAAGATGTPTALFSSGVQSGFDMWKQSALAAPVFGLLSIGTPSGIVHLPDGSMCQPPSWGQDAIINGVGRALVTAGPVLAALYLLFFRGGSSGRGR